MGHPLLGLILGAITLVGSTAWAQPAAIASGGDLLAWQTLEQRRLSGDDAVQAYQAFLLEWCESPLAVAAFDCLVDLGVTTVEASDAPTRHRVADIAERWQQLEAALVSPAVADIAELSLVADDDAAASLPAAD